MPRENDYSNNEFCISQGASSEDDVIRAKWNCLSCVEEELTFELVDGVVGRLTVDGSLQALHGLKIVSEQFINFFVDILVLEVGLSI